MPETRKNPETSEGREATTHLRDEDSSPELRGEEVYLTGATEGESTQNERETGREREGTLTLPSRLEGSGCESSKDERGKDVGYWI